MLNSYEIKELTVQHTRCKDKMHNFVIVQLVNIYVILREMLWNIVKDESINKMG